MNTTAAVNRLAHLDTPGKTRMANVSGKAVMVRSATAMAQVRKRLGILCLIMTESHKRRCPGGGADRRYSGGQALCRTGSVTSFAIAENSEH